MTHLTPEELKKSFHFRQFKSYIVDSIDWILDIIVPDSTEELNQFKSLIFINTVINPFLIQEETGWPIRKPVLSGIFSTNDYRYIGNSSLYVIFDAPYDEIINTYEADYKRVANQFDSFAKTNFPKNTYLGKQLWPFNYMVPKSLPIPKDVIVSQ